MLAPEAHSEVLRRLLNRSRLDDLGLTRVDGRWDLSGLKVQPSTSVTQGAEVAVGRARFVRASGVTEFRDVDLSDLDLRRAQLASVIFTRCRVRNCVFDDADLSRAKSFGSSFVDCSFERASLREAVLGGMDGGRRSSFQGVRFGAAKLDRADPASADFVDCDFQAAIFDRVEFWDARLTRCRFAGRLKNVIFARRRPLLGLFGHEESLVEVDFSKAAFDGVEFRGLNLDRVVLPSDPSHIVVARPRCVLQRLITELRRDTAPDPDQRGFMAIVEAELEWLGPVPTQRIFAIHELGRTNETRARAAKLIYAAAAACETGLPPS